MSKRQEKMIPVPIDDLINGMTTPVDLYVRLSDSKYILIAKEGSKTETDRLSTYKDKKLDYLWTPYSSYYRLTRQNIAIAGVAVSKASLNQDAKTKFIAAAANSVFEQLDQIGISKDTYENVRQISEATVALVQNHKDISQMFLAFEKYGNHLLRHSMAVSAVAVMLANELDWKNKLTLEKVSLGGLLHDVGKLSLPPDLVEKPRALMNYEENQMYETHSFRGLEMVTSLGLVPDDVVSIIYEHHENSIGQGFPRRLRDIKIHPMAKVVALANEYCNLTMKAPNFPNPLPPTDAVMYIDRVMGQPFNKECYRALYRLILKDSVKSAS
ncbi:MAG: HD domain-containing protein [Bdellovibrionaceae bacterium]|nr:HD domain-containing protein [Pseudobdellovibrionaceae bacterium]